MDFLIVVANPNGDGDRGSLARGSEDGRARCSEKHSSQADP